MLLITAAAIAASTPQGEPVQSAGPVVEARATARVLSAFRLRSSEEPSPDSPPARDSVIRTDGKAQPAKLIEFE